MSIPLLQLRTDGGTQTREAINYEIVADYAESMKSGASFPPVTVYYDGEAHWLADGFHRVAAARRVGRSEIEADVLQGTRRDAILHSVGSNSSHGLRRTNADKRRAVMALLSDSEWSGWSDREIARRCAVSNDFVGRMRKDYLSSDDRCDTTARKVERNGKTYTQNTANIGKAREEDEPESGGDSMDEYASFQFDDELEDRPEAEVKVDTPSHVIAGMVVRYYDTLIEDESQTTAHEVANTLLKHFRSVSIELGMTL